MRDRLIELIEASGMVEGKTRCEIIADELLSNGVILPPCKVGDTVYRVYPTWIQELKVAYFRIDEYGLNYVDIYGGEVSCDKFGKTVFLTKEEAEKALKENNNAE